MYDGYFFFWLSIYTKGLCLNIEKGCLMSLCSYLFIIKLNQFDKTQVFELFVLSQSVSM